MTHERDRRVIGRILSLGFPLPGPLVDNYSFLSAPSFFDYDALVVDPHALSALVEGALADSGDARTFAGEPVRNAPAAAGAASLGDVLLRRRDETATLLANGGAIVCFGHPATLHRGIAGAGDVDDYFWLPDGVAACCRPPVMSPGDGTQAHVVDFQHSLASFVYGQLANISYRAHFDVARTEGAAAFARSHGGAAIGVELPSAGAGRVIMLPALRALSSGDARYAMSDALQAGIRRALGVEAPGQPPPWLRAYPVPGLDERAEELATAQRQRDAAQAKLDAAQRAHDDLARYQRLLWQEGSAGLNDVVLEALRLIGFEVFARDPNDMELRSQDTLVLLEIEASESPVDLAPHFRLRQRIERAIERRGERPRALLVVNGRRLAAPDERGDQMTVALRAAAETMSYAVAPTSGLFAAVQAKLAGDDEAVAAYRCRLLSAEGLV